MTTLHLVAVAQRPTSFGMTQGNVQRTLQDGERTVTLPLPMHHYGVTGVVAVPAATLSGSVVTLDLDCWDLYDLDANRPVGGLRFRNSDPAAPDLVRIVDGYVREARHLSTSDLEEWVSSLVAAMRGGQR